MSTTVGYIPGKEASTAAAPKMTSKQEAIALAKEMGVELPDDLSRVTENKIRALIAEFEVDKDDGDEGETEQDPEGKDEGEPEGGDEEVLDPEGKDED